MLHLIESALNVEARVARFLRNWTLPLAMLAGVAIYLAFHCLPALGTWKPLAWTLNDFLAPSFIFAQLLLTFCKVEPANFRFRRWHILLLLIQLLSSVALAAGAILGQGQAAGVLCQGALICMICPTATAAAVITQRLGGAAETLITYTLAINVLCAIFVPLVCPLILPDSGMEFLPAFLLILSRVFPLLLAPFVVAQLLRVAWRGAYLYLRGHAWLSFYIWAVALALVMGRAAKSVVDDSEQMGLVVGLCLVSLATCAMQFLAGKRLGTRYGERITAGQSLGQKNTVFAMWVAVTYLDPLTSVAPGSYVLWQNIVNSYQLYKQRHRV